MVTWLDATESHASGMKNAEIADILYEIADFLEIQDVEYKPRAYRKAARNVESLSEDVESIHERGELEDVEGVGESIAEKIAEYLETGEMSYYEELKADLPIEIEAITSVEGVGPKTAKTLYRELGVQTLEDLEAAAEEGRIAEVEGFGETSQANILANLELAKAGQERMLLGRAVPIANDVRSRLEAHDAFDRVDIVGSFRRRRATVGDIDVLASATDPEAATEAFCTHDDVKEVRSRGETKSSVVVAGDLQMDLRLVEEAEYGAALVYFTGSKDHNITLRNRAIERDWKLNEYGLFDVADTGEEGQRVGDLIASETEEAVYDALDLDYIAPELREDTGEVEAAAAGELPDLVAVDDLRGDLQCHTDYSDGSASVREMAAAAAERGHDYLLVTDHGPGAPIPSKLDEEGFHAQQADVEAVNEDEDIDVTVLQGIEAEIVDGGLEVPDDWLEACDLVVVGLHGTPEDPTDDVCRVLEDYPVDVLAHPTNRLLNQREPLDLDVEAVVESAAANDVALEVNAQPERLDLDWQYVKEYRDEVDLVVSTDAHTTGELDFLHLGVSVLRRGWCESGDVLNTLSVADLRSALG
ncbi:MAG: helix-hairpin-helix domain-containing protein [Haloarculaceae archaeon]